MKKKKISKEHWLQHRMEKNIDQNGLKEQR